MSKLLVNGQKMCKYDLERMLREMATTEYELHIANSRWRGLEDRFKNGLEDTYGRTHIIGLNGHRYTLDPLMSEEEWKIHNLVCVLDRMLDYDPAYIPLNEELDKLMREYHNNN